MDITQLKRFGYLAYMNVPRKTGPKFRFIGMKVFTSESVSRQATFQQWNVSSFRRACSNVNIETYGVITCCLPRAESSVVRALECVAGNNNSPKSALSQKY